MRLELLLKKTVQMMVELCEVQLPRRARRVEITEVRAHPAVGAWGHAAEMGADAELLRPDECRVLPADGSVVSGG